MGIGTILIGLALLIVIIVLIVSPLLEPHRPAAEPPNRYKALEMERATIVRSIRELDLDYKTHKLNEDDYKALREVQVQRGAALLRDLDQLKGQDAIDAEIEERVAAVRASSTVCLSCGASLHAGDRFCANCGHGVAKTEKTAASEGKR